MWYRWDWKWRRMHDCIALHGERLLPAANERVLMWWQRPLTTRLSRGCDPVLKCASGRRGKYAGAWSGRALRHRFQLRRCSGVAKPGARRQLSTVTLRNEAGR
eukprot:364416-Chlamydomonas_euryale.AAC.20